MTHISFWFILMLTFLGGERKHTIKKNTEALLAASKETGLHVNAQKSKRVLCFMRKTGYYHNMKADNKSVESVEE